MSIQWYVLRLKPNSESLAVSGLEKDGIEVFSPRVQTPRQDGSFVESHLFPGYLFLQFDMQKHDTDLVRGLPGVLGWVRFDGVIPPVPDVVVRELASRVRRVNEGGGLWNRFMPGDGVRIVSGRMESLGEVLEEAKSPHARVRVLLDFMGRMVQADVPWNTLSPVNQTDEPVEARRGRRRTRGQGRWIRGVGPRSITAG